MNLLKVSSFGISPEYDIVNLIPRDELQHCFDSVCDAMDKLDSMTKCPDGSVSYRVDDYNGCQGSSEIPYANYVHSVPGHKCWLVDQSSLDPHAEVHKNHSHDVKANLANDYNDQILQFVVNALIAKGYFKPKNPSDVTQMLDIFRAVEKYIGRGVEAIYYLSTARKDIKRYTYPSEVDNSAGWVNSVLIQWSLDMSATDKTNLMTSLRNARFNLTINFGSSTEVNQAVIKYVDELRSHNVAFMFLCHNDDGYGKMLVFNKYRNYANDQAAIRVTTTTKIMTNIPDNIELLANVGGSFTFDASVEKPNSLYSMTVNDKHYTLNSRGLTALAKLGISITERADVELYNQVTITINKIKSNMQIHLADAPVASPLIAQRVFSVDTEETNKPSIILSVPTINNVTDIEGILQFRFSGAVDENFIERANVELIPVYLYDKLENEDGKFIPTKNEISFINVGFNDSKICQVHFSGESVNIGNTFLVRVTFPEKSIVGSAFVAGTNNPTPIKYFNPKFIMQFEIRKDTSEIVSISESLKMPLNTWSPMIPNPVLTTRFKLSNADIYPWYTLNEEDGVFTLTKNEDYAGEIPNLVPESSIYQPIITYKTINNDDPVEVPENAKFAVFSVPVGLLLPYYYSNGDQIDIVSMTVISDVPVKFNNMVCYDSAYFRRSSDGREGIFYNTLKRPYLNGYIDVPVLFTDKDTVEINVCMTHVSTITSPSNGLCDMTCTVTIDLPESVIDPDEGSGEEPSENPDTGDGSDTPIDGDITEPDTPSEGENTDGDNSGEGTTGEESGTTNPETPSDEPSKDTPSETENTETGTPENGGESAETDPSTNPDDATSDNP